MMAEVSGGLAAALHYNTVLFTAETAERMLAHLQALLVGLAAEPERPVSLLPLLPELERERLLHEWNATTVDYPAGGSFYRLFEEQVARTPEAAAVTDGETSYSYRELNQRANQLAHYLVALGVGPEVLVGAALERSAEMVAALLAVHKAGGAYIPLDPAFPQARLEMMLADARPAVLLVGNSLIGEESPAWLPTDSEGMQVINLEKDWPQIVQYPVENLTGPALPDSLAYMIYTSGSTGRPKGVQISQRALVNFLTTMAERPGLAASDTLLAVTTLSFDIAGLELFLPLMVGARVVIAGREVAADAAQLQEMMTGYDVTVMQATPATWRLLLAADWPGKRGLKILCGGEALPVDLAAALLERSAELWNVYGPTETTIWSTIGRVEAETVEMGGGTVSIGRPIGNTQVYILDKELQPVPVGVAGDLYIGGDGLARGYYRQAALTAGRFVPDPFVAGGDGRLYRTGDLARYLADGRIVFLGRDDHQVKIRGFRIELGDIEAALGQHPALAQNVVVAGADGNGEQRLVAYLVARPGEMVPPVELLREFLAERLPWYMVPAMFMNLEAMPLTPNGKVNRRVLPEPELDRPLLAAEYVGPRTALEQQLANLCAGVLGLERIGIHDNFFEMGGNSLLATRLIGRVREISQAPVSLRLLFAEPTVAGLARAIEANGQDGRTAGQNGRGQTSGQGLFEEMTVEDLMAEAVLDPGITAGGRVYEPVDKPEQVFLTGATGFLGAFLLRTLLLETDTTVFCLVRAANKGAGLARLQQNLERYGLWKPEFETRIETVLGDLGRPLLGLNERQFGRLARQVEAIYHNGAMVNFVYPYEAHRAANVRGTEEILRLAAAGPLKPVHFVSTLSVFHTGDHDDGTVFVEPDDLKVIGAPFGGYAQSKWVAEQLVLAAGVRGIPVAVYRPGLVSGDSRSGAWNTDDMMTTLARASLAIGRVPDLDIRVDVVPVDYVSRAIITLSLLSASIGGTFHLSNPRPMNYEDLLDWMETQGIMLEKVPFAEWRQRLGELMVDLGGDEVSAFAPLLEEVTAEQVFMPAFDCSNTLAGLKGKRVKCPPVGPKLLRTYFEFLVGEGMR
jgi:amino acid adenylation domain-containing protein/thioester reductase-like protein